MVVGLNKTTGCAVGLNSTSNIAHLLHSDSGGLSFLVMQNIDMNAQNFDGRLSVADSTALTVLQLDNVQLSHGVLSQMTNLVHLTQLILFNITPDQVRLHESWNRR